ncbi:MAG: hypothetical protein NT167_01795 [Verrucomicrobia bacterium]|nr:hypothetical protein [Verrucomicrobiota bacterium]
MATGFERAPRQGIGRPVTPAGGPVFSDLATIRVAPIDGGGVWRGFADRAFRAWPVADPRGDLRPSG